MVIKVLDESSLGALLALAYAETFVVQGDEYYPAIANHGTLSAECNLAGNLSDAEQFRNSCRRSCRYVH